MDGLLQKDYHQERVALSCHPKALHLRTQPAPGAVLAFRAPKHIVLIPRRNCGLSLFQALTCVKGRKPGMVSWLTGPSRTADIEKVLVLGAQGPANLDMILYREEE